MSDKPPSLLGTLQEAADCIHAHAKNLRDCHVDRRGRWGEESIARGWYREEMAIVKRLRKCIAYMKPNPMGGPAVAFDMIADRIRAGDAIEDAMEDYGVRWIKKQPPLPQGDG